MKLPDDLTPWERFLMSVAMGVFAGMTVGFFVVVGFAVLVSGLGPD